MSTENIGNGAGTGAGPTKEAGLHSSNSADSPLPDVIVFTGGTPSEDGPWNEGVGCLGLPDSFRIDLLSHVMRIQNK